MANRQYTSAESNLLLDILANRRDVRGNRFTDKPIDDKIINRLLNAATLAPSVGFSQPWRFVVVRDDATKQQIRQSYEHENAKAKEIFEERDEYKRLKLEGILESPVNIAVFYQPKEGPVLGQTSQPQVGLYSVVCAVQNLWLMARAENIGVGWVSILDENKVKNILNAPAESQLVAYLCLGYVTEFLEKPELETLAWEQRQALENIVFDEKFDEGSAP